MFCPLAQVLVLFIKAVTFMKTFYGFLLTEAICITRNRFIKQIAQNGMLTSRTVNLHFSLFFLAHKFQMINDLWRDMSGDNTLICIFSTQNVAIFQDAQIKFEMKIHLTHKHNYFTSKLDKFTLWNTRFRSTPLHYVIFQYLMSHKKQTFTFCMKHNHQHVM